MKTSPAISKLLLLALCASPLLALENDGPRRDQLRRLRGAINAYGMLNPGKIPEKLSALVDESLLDGPSSLMRPGSKDAVPPRAELDARADYTLESLGGAADLVVREKSPLPGETEVLAIFKDGSIRALAAPVASGQAVSPPPAENTRRPPPITAGETTLPSVLPPPATTADDLPPVLNPLPAQPARPPPPAPVLGSRTGPANLADAQTALATGRVADARAIFAAAAQRDPRSAEAFIGLGRCANLQGDLDGAMTAYFDLARFAPTTPNLRLWIVELFIARGNLRSAQQWLDTELTMQPDSAWAWSWRGTLQLETGDREAATVSMARAAALQREVSSFRFQNGAALLNHNQPKRAAKEFAAALLLDPRGTGAYYQLAECHARLGERDKAIENFRRYLQGDATSEWAVRARARIEELGRSR